MLGEDRCQSSFDALDASVQVTSRRRSPSRNEGIPDAVGVRVDAADRAAFRAEETVAEHVVAVTTHQRHVSPVEVQLETARRLTKRTGPRRDGRHTAEG
jgi:hypothetical protein